MKTTADTTYRAARASGKGTADSCRAVLAAHPDADFDAVVDLSWRIETGKAMPQWVTEDGEQTDASRAWDRGHEGAEIGE